MQTINTLQEITANPDAIAKKWKENGKKVAGYRCLFVPEEIIWAAGMLPYPLYGTQKPVSQADSYFQPCTCEFIRNIFDNALDGRYKFLDCLVFPVTCDVMRRFPDLWKAYIDDTPFHMINNPQKLMNDGNRDYYIEELNRFKIMIEKISGTKVTDEKLNDAIDLYNEMRSLMKELYSLREQDPPLLNGKEAFEIAMAVTIMPKDEANILLRRLIDEIKDRDVEDTGATRILVTGSFIEHPTLIQMIEEEGGIVVADDLCTTTRYFWDDVDHHDDPVEALYRYMNKRPICPCMHPYETRLEYINTLVDRYNAQAVINFNLKYCHPALYEAPFIKDEMEAKGIPVSTLEIGHDMSGMGQLRTRIQAFIEMVDF